MQNDIRHPSRIVPMESIGTPENERESKGWLAGLGGFVDRLTQQTSFNNKIDHSQQSRPSAEKRSEKAGSEKNDRSGPVSAKSLGLLARIINSPIACGYLRLFCDEENLTPYLDFYLAVKDFQSHYQQSITHSGPSSSGSGGSDKTKMLDEFRHQARMLNIYYTYLADKTKDDDNIFKRGDSLGREDGFGDISAVHARTSWAPSPLPHKSDAHRIDREISRTEEGPIAAACSGTRALRGAPASPRAMHSSGKGASPAVINAKAFLPAAVVASVRDRIERHASWGTQVFDDAVDAVVKILHSEAFPRFQKSPLFAKMMARERLAVDVDERALPQAHTLHVKPPRSQIRENVLGPNGESYVAQYAGKHYTLEEILEDGLLFEELQAHLDKSYSSDSLICLRMVAVFKEVLQRDRDDHAPQRSPRSRSRSHSVASRSSFDGENDEGGQPSSAQSRKRHSSIFFNAQRAIDDHAWSIYLYFVAVGAAHEIGIASKCRDAVMKDLASPHEHMFAELEAVAYAELTTQFRDFKNTVSYEMLGRRAVATAKVPTPTNVSSILGATSLSLGKRFAVHPKA